MSKGKIDVYHGSERCREKLSELLTEMELPDWLMPLVDINEFGHELDTGYTWLKLNKRKKEKLEEIDGQEVSYDTHITAYVKHKQIKNLAGVQAKVLLIWFTVSEILVDHPSQGTVTFRTLTPVFSKTFKI